MGIFSKLKHKIVKPKREPVVIGAFDSDLVEIREDGKVHYQVQTLNGLKQLLESIEAERGNGAVKIDWWVAGLHFKLSAGIPLDILHKLHKETNGSQR